VLGEENKNKAFATSAVSWRLASSHPSLRKTDFCPLMSHALHHLFGLPARIQNNEHIVVVGDGDGRRNKHVKNRGGCLLIVVAVADC